MSHARDRRIEIIKQRLLRRSSPRLQVSVLLLLTGFAGFLTSFSLLHLGVTQMSVRYPIVILISYVVFLLLLRVWLWFRGRRLDSDFDSSALDFGFAEGRTREIPGFNGGDGGGAGAGGGWSEDVSSISATSSARSGSSSGDFDPGLDEGCVIVIAIVAIVGGVVACLYVIYIAPALLAEILVDGVLMAGLYKRLKHIEQRHWLRAALRRTLPAAILAAIFFAVAGYALQKAVPEAHTIGQVWAHATRTQR